ncbi:MAG: membrane protein insertase YidC [Defluviimonas sp.]|uniref:membrane protein insertase YidC n=1 Tax=Albidovulum sp. TaxID=1872424 RepID=UPI001D49EF08|nr:membrane protein insertase YidC [Paracoccaceae bacterium]MCC0064673.1 membrane protein insertase YidC [Defluviimonas sp.]
MEDQNKNLILATVLSFIVILLWYTLFPPPTATDKPSDTASVAQEAGTATTAGGAPATAGPDSTSPFAAPEAAAVTDSVAAAVSAAPRITIDTPRLTGTISLYGGRFDDLRLRDYKRTIAPDSPDVRLLTPLGGAGAEEAFPYYAIYGWQPAGGLAPEAVPGARTLWTLEAGTTLAPGQPVTIAWDNGAGLIFHRKIEVDDSYMFTVTQTVENRTGAAVRLAPYGLVVRHGVPKAQRTYVRHEGIVRESDGILGTIQYSKIPKLDAVQGEGQADIVPVAHDGWIGFTDAYWMTTLIPTPGSAFTSVVKYVPNGEIYQAEARQPVQEVAAGASLSSASMLFAGAKEWDTIKFYENEPDWIDRLFGKTVDAGRPQIRNFIEAIDWGWFFFLTKPMFRVLHWLHGAIGNMGWAIIALTFLIKALVFPLARHSYISMARMKELQPEMEKLKENAGEDRQKLQQGMMELYKKNKVNPASGCLPIFLQIPIFFSLYKVIYVTIELYHARWIGWIRDLSAPDPSSILNLFGLLPWAAPEHGSIFFILSLGVLPILLGISMWFQQKLNPAPTDPTQQMIFAWMPWIFMFMLGSFASGLVLYWITNNTITFIQQYSIMTMHGKRPDLFGNIRSGFKRRSGAKEKAK